MISMTPAGVSASEVTAKPQVGSRAVVGNDATILADIYKDDVNLAIWQRDFSETLRASVDNVLKRNPSVAMTVTPQSTAQALSESLGLSDRTGLIQEATDLVDMFCELFALKRVGLRLRVLTQAMCPKFHVDRVPCRLVTTFQGSGTQWLDHSAVDRSKLGRRIDGRSDHQAGLYSSEDDVRRLGCGDVALLKGELWEGNESRGVVHRSPDVSDGSKRLLFTLDFCE